MVLLKLEFQGSQGIIGRGVLYLNFNYTFLMLLESIGQIHDSLPATHGRRARRTSEYIGPASWI